MNKFCKSKADGNVFKNMFVGVDVHKNYLQVAILDEKGSILYNSQDTDHVVILKTLRTEDQDMCILDSATSFPFCCDDSRKYCLCDGCGIETSELRAYPNIS